MLATASNAITRLAEIDLTRAIRVRIDHDLVDLDD